MEKATLTTEKIRLWGIVQGVGFRPFVAKVADRLSMKGEVLNIGGLVDITVTDTEERIGEFIETLVREKPGPSEIVHIRRQKLPLADFDRFTIIKSDEGDDEAAMIPADLAICPDCLRELYDKDNPRYLHPFISCQLCGPRYTIIDRIPYDRDNTSMIDFPMCDFCEGEYTDLHDRRHHAQTISCHECGPELIWIDTDAKAGVPAAKAGAADDDSSILDRAADVLKRGGVVAFKSVGGYNLVADPFNEEAVSRLREIKNRETKPFAVMFRSLDEIKEYCSVDEVEEKLLQSSARPIILLEHKLNELENAEGEVPGSRSFEDLKRSRFIGSFLPSFAAQYMLLDRISPLIFTSANPSDMPMIKDEDEIVSFCEKTGKVGGIIANRRRINVRVDDSVTRVIDGQPQMIRRSKGYAPVPLYVSAGSRDDEPAFSMLACGGQLKNSFALTKGPFAYVSQFFGDMDTVENQKIYDENVTRMADLFRIKPQAVICDMHPLYQPTLYAEKYAGENGLPLLKVQHHHAHVASVMAENNLEGKVIGVSFDGTGYGTDGTVWGGEFLRADYHGFERLGSIEPFCQAGGDRSSKEGWRIAVNLLYSLSGSKEKTIETAGRLKLASAEQVNAQCFMADNGVNCVTSTSAGRLFDAVSAVLGIRKQVSFEGEAAMFLEYAARNGKKKKKISLPEIFEREGRFILPTAEIFSNIVERTLSGDEPPVLARFFHEALADEIVAGCERAREMTGITTAALSGGVFQNLLLLELVETGTSVPGGNGRRTGKPGEARL